MKHVYYFSFHLILLIDQVEKNLLKPQFDKNYYFIHIITYGRNSFSNTFLPNKKNSRIFSTIYFLMTFKLFKYRFLMIWILSFWNYLCLSFRFFHFVIIIFILDSIQKSSLIFFPEHSFSQHGSGVNSFGYCHELFNFMKCIIIIFYRPHCSILNY